LIYPTKHTTPARLLAASLAFACLLALDSALAQMPSTHHHGFGDAEHWAHVFDDPERDAWQKPHEVIRSLALPPDAIVADIGSGTGYFTVRFAHMLPAGRVYGVDIEPDMVRYLAQRAQKDGLANIVSIAGAPDDPRLPEKVDLIILVDTYHHIDERGRYLERLREDLKPGGRIALIDFTLESPEGPPKDARIAPSQAKAEFAEAGYELAAENTFLPKQYFLVFRVKAAAGKRP
jgi:SAM-dependent methyltransferase